MLFNRGIQTSSIVAAALLAASAMPGVAQPVAPDDSAPPVAVIDYDEAGYARWPAAAETGADAASAAIWVTHAMLPADSFVEITRIDTGRTILARVVGRGATTPPAPLVGLSAGAASLLKLDGEGQTAVRVRRVNPPEAEKAALRAGKAASERIDTPEMLLSVLRKKAGPAPAMSTQPIAPPEKPAALFEAPATSPAPALAPKATETAPKKPEPSPKAAPVAPPKAAPKPTVTPTEKLPAKSVARQPAAATGSWFVQVAALSSKAKADQLARQIGGSVQAAGSMFRVRTGPYPDQAAARAALGPIAAKGYRDARITR
jgi:rare lipoprotein A